MQTLLYSIFIVRSNWEEQVRKFRIAQHSFLFVIAFFFINMTLVNLFIRQGKLKAELVNQLCCQILPSETAAHHLKNLNKFHNQFIVILLVSC